MIDFSKLFSLYAEPVIVASGEKIIYKNKSAKEFLPDLGEAHLSAVIPEMLLPQDMDSFVGEVNIRGRKTKFSYARIEDCAVISFFDTGDDAREKSDREFLAISVRMNEYLAVLKMAAGVVLPYIENIGDKNLTEYSAMINHSYYNVLRLTENMRILGEEKADTAHPRMSEFELVKFCSDICHTCGLLISEKHAKTSFHSEARTIYVRADREKLEMMLLNLISNSLVNTDNSDVIAVSLMVTADAVRLSVRDTGRGIPDEGKASGWNSYKEPIDFNNPLDGAGYGLAVVSHVARLHGGGAFFSSAEGKGTTVVVSLPIVKNDSAGFRDEIEDYAAGGLNSFLTGLSTVLPNDRYTQKYLD